MRTSYSDTEVNDFNDQPQAKEWADKSPFEREKAEDNRFEEFRVLENAYRLHSTLYQEVRLQLYSTECLLRLSTYNELTNEC